MEKGEDFFLRDNQAIEQNEALSEKSKRRLNRSKAENTVKAYDADWRDFMDWCAAHEKTPPYGSVSRKRSVAKTRLTYSTRSSWYCFQNTACSCHQRCSLRSAGPRSIPSCFR